MNKKRTITGFVLSLMVTLVFLSCSNLENPNRVLNQKDGLSMKGKVTKITLQKPGTLANLLRNQKVGTELDLTGPIDGTDIGAIRSMLNNGLVDALDLSRTQIVAGGQAYYIDYNKKEYFTGNDSIGAYMFSGIKLKKIILPESITYIGYKAFQAIETNTITIPDQVVVIDSMAFESSTLPSILLPNSLRKINAMAFQQSEISNIILPESVDEIGSDAFEGCSNLQSIDIPSKVTVIHSDMFYKCQNLRSISLSPATTVIENGAFAACAFETITLPASIESIGDDAFISCNRLNEVHCLATKPPILGKEVFGEIPLTALLFVPKDCKSAYKADYNWVMSFDQIIEE